MEGITHGTGQPVTRKAVQNVIDEVSRRKEKFHCMYEEDFVFTIEEHCSISVSKQEIESLCTIFRHFTKGGDKGKKIEKKSSSNERLLCFFFRKNRSKSFSRCST